MPGLKVSTINQTCPIDSAIDGRFKDGFQPQNFLPKKVITP